MSDIVERLLSMTGEDPGAIPPESVYGEWIIAAADEIVRLRAEVARKDAEVAKRDAALRRWENSGCPDCGGDCSSANPPVACCIIQETRAALTTQEDNSNG